MKRILFCLVIFLGVAILWSEMINVPEDYDSIQSAIGAAVDGDEIIVSPGTYYENIDFDGKAITLASLFYTTQDTSYISETIIDGSQTGRVVTFNSEETANSVLCGFTITNGYAENHGGGIYIGEYCSPTITHLRIISNQAEYYGGGFYFAGNSSSVINNLLVSGNSSYNGAGGAYNYYCDLVMEDSEITSNVSSNSGGGIIASETTIEFRNVVVENNSAEHGGGFCFEGWDGSNILNNVIISQNQATDSGGGIETSEELYLENVTITENVAAEMGGGICCYYGDISFAEDLEERCDIYSNFCDQGYSNDIYSNSQLNIKLNIFSVQYPTDYYVSPSDNFSYDVLDWVIDQIDEDVYISPTGSDENSGISEDSPFQTIIHACALLAVSNSNKHTIFLDSGIYSASTTGEIYPIRLPDNMNLCGKDRESVILDAEGNSRILILDYVDNIDISGLTITNGLADYGGGIKGHYADVVLKNLIITGNSSTGSGGGLYLSYGSSILDNVLIYGNTSANYGGGIYSTYNGFSIIKNVTICDNTCSNTGGGVMMRYSQSEIINSIISNNIPNAITCNSSSSVLSLAYSDIVGGTGEISVIAGTLNLLDGMIYSDSLFVDAANGDYNLTDNSPCIDRGTAYFEYDGEIWIDLQENEYWGDSPDMGAYEYGSIYYGDVDDNMEVESYDAALVLMHTVGIDPLLEDPLPWEEWRFQRADVDLDGDIGAIDGAYILQYVVGILDGFPVLNSIRAWENPITVSGDMEYLYLSSGKDIISLSFRIVDCRNIRPGKTEVLKNDCLYFENEGSFALASANSISGNIMRIPYERKADADFSITLELEINGNPDEISYTFGNPVPSITQLNAVYPNPFNPETTIAYQLAETGNVRLEVYNVKGQKVAILLNEEQTAGDHLFIWDAAKYNSGVYFIRLTSRTNQGLKKAILLK